MSNGGKLLLHHASTCVLWKPNRDWHWKTHGRPPLAFSLGRNYWQTQNLQNVFGQCMPWWVTESTVLCCQFLQYIIYNVQVWSLQCVWHPSSSVNMWPKFYVLSIQLSTLLTRCLGPSLIALIIELVWNLSNNSNPPRTTHMSRRNPTRSSRPQQPGIQNSRIRRARLTNKYTL